MQHRVHGVENRVTDGPRIIVVNHQSALDIPAILIDRSNRDDSIHKLHDAAEIVKKDQVSVIIFPEGTRGDGKTGLLPFKRGAFHLAVEAQVPIQPVVIAPYSWLDIPNRVAKGGCIAQVISDELIETDWSGDEFTTREEESNDCMHP
ncbi:putative 1-acyl-sn-glycerol-3-phosphate acyltransferase acl-2 [Taenia solium]|eukprot:TsM_001083100 transcript=TsM_001083100 gene=TsM_001083100